MEISHISIILLVNGVSGLTSPIVRSNLGAKSLEELKEAFPLKENIYQSKFDLQISIVLPLEGLISSSL